MSYHLRINNLLDNSYAVYPMGSNGYRVTPPSEDHKEGEDELNPFIACVAPYGQDGKLYRIPAASYAEVLSSGEMVEVIYSPTEETVKAIVEKLQERAKGDSEKVVESEDLKVVKDESPAPSKTKRKRKSN